MSHRDHLHHQRILCCKKEGTEYNTSFTEREKEDIIHRLFDL